MASWLSEFASKAEQLLESVDQAAAKQLSHAAENQRSSSSGSHRFFRCIFIDLPPEAPSLRSSEAPVAETSAPRAVRATSGQTHTRSSSNSTKPVTSKSEDDVDLFAFLNSKPGQQVVEHHR